MHRGWSDFRKWYSVPFLLLLFYSLGGIWGVYLSGRLAFAQAPAPTPSADSKTIDDLKARLQESDRQIADLTAKAAAMEKRADDLKSLLAVLAGLGTVFGLALGISTYVNLKDTQQNADNMITAIRTKAQADLVEIRKSLTDAQQNAGTVIDGIRDKAKADLDEIRADFPAIAKLNRKIGEIVGELRRLVLREWDQASYAQLEVEDRQNILLQEVTFRALHVFEHEKVPAYARTIPEINRGFGRFYSSRYTSGKPFDKAAWERAVFYLNAASGSAEEDLFAAAQQDLGVLYAHQGDLENDPAAWSGAIRCLENARVVNKTDPRIPLTLAWIAKRQNNIPAALNYVEQVIATKPAPEERYLTLAKYNRACYWIRDARSKSDPDKRQSFLKAIDELWEVKKAALAKNPEWWAENLRSILPSRTGTGYRF